MSYEIGKDGDIHALIQGVKKKDRAEREQLERFLHQCKRVDFRFFGHMGLGEFERWNDQRLAALHES